MARFEKVKGSAVTKLFEELISYRMLVNLKVLNSDFQQLTRIKALADRNNEPHFIIETPEGFQQAAGGAAPWRIRFEFRGRDYIQYTFKTTGGEVDGNRIFLKMPPVVERNQRRRLFRINAPKGTKLCLTLKGIRPELEVVNLSIGGSLAALVQTDADVKACALFTENSFLRKAELVFPAEIMRQPIEIGAIQIKRMRMNSETERCEVGLEFYEIGKIEQRKLTDLIYRLQRQHLRKRLPIDL